MDKNFYNESSSDKLGWEPEWFGCDEFDEDLVAAIKKFQKKNGMSADGLCGPGTFRVLFNERMEDIEQFRPAKTSPGEKFIICNGDYFPIDWPKVKLFFEGDGLKLTKGLRKHVGERNPSFFVCHWDVCLSSKTCHKVLEKRGISVHFAIDNDGTIYQFMDMNDVAYHAGGRTWNNKSIGVEIANAYYPKYQGWYKKNGLGERPLVEGAKVHGKTLDPFMDFYPEQYEALKALMKAVHEATGIPLEAPLDRSGNTNTTVSKKAADGRFEGFVSHYHLKRGKIDCANLDLKTILEHIKNA
jgi:peptidoglycan hydrolase-like protein with peptidoglycan-binding domain